MKPILEVRDISKKFRIHHEHQPYLNLRESISSLFKNKSKRDDEDFWALKNVNFNINQGESVGIIGKNGAGKSTLLKILSKITPPTSGKIISRGRIASLLEVGTGFHTELSGKENIFLNGSILGMKRKEIERKFDEIVDFSGVRKFIDTPIKHYSSGMQLRLAFSVAAFLEPEILIIDEVLAVGDAEFQNKCIGKMDEVSKSGRTVLFVSHNLGTILQLCKRCILLNEGEVKMNDLAKIVVEKYYNQNPNEFVSGNSKNTDIYIKKIFTCDEAGRQVNNFSHANDIHLRIEIGVKKYDPQQNIGLQLLTKDKKKVFTVNKALKEFYAEGDSEITVDFIIEGGLIAPMQYSFLVALNTRTGSRTYVWHEDICPIKVYDDGTDFSFAEGMDYGCIILKDKWNLIEKK